MQESEEYKITQFADDTTIILDGSERSLLSALNTTEIFGTCSGLKMNTSKLRKNIQKKRSIQTISLTGLLSQRQLLISPFRDRIQC